MNGVHRVAFLALAASAATGASGQNSAARIEQQNRDAGPAAEQVAAPQISNRSGEAVVPAPQLSDPAERPAPVPQLTSERRGAGAGTQLSRGPRTAREPDPLSRPSEGRTGAVARVDGEDRCADEDPAKRPAVCARVIETRAAEFQRPRAPVLSPEQRLLVDQRLREAGLVARAVNTRGMDSSEIDPDRPEGQALASAALNRAAEREAAAERAASPASALPEVPAALVEVILGTPVPPTTPPR